MRSSFLKFTIVTLALSILNAYADDSKNADYQKTKFRSVASNKNKFITTGLWSLSRHPNYLGEIVLWFGIALMSFSNLNGLQYITLISPVFTYWLLVYVSGIKILETSGKKKWGHLKTYNNYIKNTPKLFFKIFN